MTGGTASEWFSIGNGSGVVTFAHRESLKKAAGMRLSDVVPSSAWPFVRP